MTTLNKVVKVTILAGAVSAAVNSQAVGLIVGVSTGLPIGDRIRFYSDLASVGLDFAASSEEYKAATKYFGQNPRPSRVAIGRRFVAPVAAELLGGSPAALATLQAITTGAFSISIDGAVKQVTGIDLSAASNMNAVASAIQTRLVAAQAGTTAVWTGSRFKLTSGTTGAASAIGFAGAPATGTDVSALLALDSNSGGRTTQGSAAESVTQSLANLQGANGGWYGFVLTAEATQQNQLDAAAWAEGTLAKFYTVSSNASNKDASNTTSLAYLLKASSYSRTLSVYSLDPYAAASVMGLEAGVDYEQPNSIITLFLKTLPGVAVTPLSDSEILALEANRMNYYTNFGSDPGFANGVMADGTYSDQRSGLDWFTTDLQQNVFAFLRSRATKVAQTDKGVAAVISAIEKTGAKALDNGLLAPGVWDGDDLGTVKSGDTLPRGFYFYAAPVRSQSKAQRATRIAPPISGIAIGAGAIHGVNIAITYQP